MELGEQRPVLGAVGVCGEVRGSAGFVGGQVYMEFTETSPLPLLHVVSVEKQVLDLGSFG